MGLICRTITRGARAPSRSQGHLCLSNPQSNHTGRARVEAHWLSVRNPPSMREIALHPCQYTDRLARDPIGSSRVRTTVLGSRSQLCIHPRVSKVASGIQSQSCRQLVSAHRCKFHDKVAGTHPQPHTTMPLFLCERDRGLIDLLIDCCLGERRCQT